MAENSNNKICNQLSGFIAEREMKEFFELISDLLKSQGTLSEVSRETALNRESLYKTLRGDRDSRFSTVLELLNYLGIEIEFKVTANSLERKLLGVSGFEAPWLEMFLETPDERLKNADSALEQFNEIND